MGGLRAILILKNSKMNPFFFKTTKLISLCTVALTTAFLLSCEEEIPKNSILVPELEKPIYIPHEPGKILSYDDIYYGMDLSFYVPPGIDELKNRPFLFTLSTMRNSSVTGSMLSVVEKYGMIAVSPKNGNDLQFKAFVETMIATEYVDSTKVFMAGFSNGGRDVYELAWGMQDKVKGVVLLDPSAMFSGEPKENSILSVCIVCQEERVNEYGGSVSGLNSNGIKAKIISVKGTDHFGILSPFTENQKKSCFEFVLHSD